MNARSLGRWWATARIAAVAWIVLALVALAQQGVLAQAPMLTVGGFEIASQVRIGRTVYEYVVTATIANSTPNAARNVRATASSLSSHTTIVDGALSFGDVPPYTTVRSMDTFTIRHDRLYPFDWGALAWVVAFDLPDDPNAKVVGPAGGIFEFPIGITLQVPSGALDQAVTIRLTDLSCTDLDAAQTPRQLSTYKRRCLRGFAATPEGLRFNVPVKASFAVRLDPGEIPVRIEAGPGRRAQWIGTTELIYRGAGGIVELALTHFSDEWLAAFANVVEQTCKYCDTYMSDLCGSTLVEPNPWFLDLQPGACWLLKQPDERAKCAARFGYGNVQCCMEDVVEVRVTEVDFSSGTCQIVGSTVDATFPSCPGMPTQTSSEATTADCPSDARYTLNVIGDDSWIYACQSTKLGATVSATFADGRTLFEDAPFPASWEIASGDGSAKLGQEVPPNGVVIEALETAGLATIRARAEGDSRLSGEYALEVRDMKLEILAGDDLVLRSGDSQQVLAPCVPCTQPISWTSSNESVARVAGLPGDAARVTAGERGTATIVAWTQDLCGHTIQDTLRVTVRKTEVTVVPVAATIAVSEAKALSATVIDGEGCTLNWYSSDLGVANVTQAGVVTGVARGTANISAVCGDAVGWAAIRVKKTAVVVTPGQATVAVGGDLSLTAAVVDGDGCSLSWYSNNIDVATVSSSGAVHGVAAGTANISASCGGATGVSAITVVPPHFVVTWEGRRQDTTSQRCNYEYVYEGPWTYDFHSTHDWTGTATVEGHRNVVALASEASQDVSSVKEYFFTKGACIDHGLTKSTMAWTMTDLSRIKSRISGLGVFIIDHGNGPEIDDPLMEPAGCPSLYGHASNTSSSSGTCPPVSSFWSWENDTGAPFCIPGNMKGALRPEDASLRVFSKNEERVTTYTNPHDCGYGVEGTETVTTAVRWSIRIVRQP